jgi:hypothetical protein
MPVSQGILPLLCGLIGDESIQQRTIDRTY